MGENGQQSCDSSTKKKVILYCDHFKIFFPAVADMVCDLRHDKWMTSQSFDNYLDWCQKPHGMHQDSLYLSI